MSNWSTNEGEGRYACLFLSVCVSHRGGCSRPARGAPCPYAPWWSRKVAWAEVKDHIRAGDWFKLRAHTQTH